MSGWAILGLTIVGILALAMIYALGFNDGYRQAEKDYFDDCD